MMTKIKPQLAVMYEAAHSVVLNTKTYVPQKKWKSFDKRGKILHDNDISHRVYAYTVVSILQDWLKKKDFRSVPINVFCGDWAYDLFMEVHDSESVIIHSDDDHYRELLYTELIVSRRYLHLNIQNGVIHKFGDVVDELKDILDPDWLELYETGTHRPQSVDVLEMLEEEYGVYPVRSLTDILTKLVLER